MKNSLHLILILSMIVPPSAFAGKRDRDYRAICNGNVDAEKEGASLKDECHKTKLMVAAKNVERVKFSLLTTATIAAGVGLILENTGYGTAAGKAMCAAIGIAVPIATLAMDVGATIAFKKEVNGAMMGGQLMTALIGFQGFGAKYSTYQNAIYDVKNAKAIKAGTKSSKSSNDKSSCSGTLLSIVPQNLMSGMNLAMQLKMLDKQLETDKSLKEIQKHEITDDGYTPPSTGFISKTGPSAPTNANNGSAPMNSASADPCDGVSSLACAGKASPEVSAMMADRGLNNLVKDLSGKSLSDFVNGIQGDTPEEITASVGSQLGLSGAFAQSIMDKASDAAKHANLLKDYQLLAYARNPAKAASGKDDADFAKIMADMLKALNPEAANDEAAKKDASELVFRQMDLLPPDKIESNKDISLFARIGYRYRKNLTNVEQLNWSAPENQNNGH